MIFINEWLPNPAGSDKTGEWIEIFNSGSTPVSLEGWVLKNGSGQKFVLKNYQISANGYLVLPREQTKLVLRNSDEKIFLYNEKGQLIGQSGFLGAAPEGKSFSRQGDAFVWTDPTPSQQNKFSSAISLSEQNHPFSQPLNSSLPAFSFLELLLGTALIFAAAFIFLIKKDENLSQLFFGRDQEIR